MLLHFGANISSELEQGRAHRQETQPLALLVFRVEVGMCPDAQRSCLVLAFPHKASPPLTREQKKVPRIKLIDHERIEPKTRLIQTQRIHIQRKGRRQRSLLLLPKSLTRFIPDSGETWTCRIRFRRLSPFWLSSDSNFSVTSFLSKVTLLQPATIINIMYSGYARSLALVQPSISRSNHIYNQAPNHSQCQTKQVWAPALCSLAPAQKVIQTRSSENSG
jgi:hypothetical protein